MSPTIAANNITDISPVYAIFQGQSLLRGALSVTAANFNNLFSSQFAVVVSLLRFVLHVIGMSTEKQVSGINAGRIVAAMTDAHAIWDRAIMQFVTKAMCRSHSVFDSDLAVAIRIQMSGPQPTISSLLDLGPESFFCGDRVAVPVQKAQRLPFNPSIKLAVFGCKSGRLTATTFAEMYRGVVRGMITHVDTFLSRFGHASGLLAAVAGALLLGSYRSNCSANGRFSQVAEA